MSIADILILGTVFILGVVTGALSNVTSGGAGVFTTFVLARYGNFSIQQAVGTVLAASTIIVLVGAITFYRKKEVDGQLSITVGLAGVAGAFVAAMWASSLQSALVEHAFGVFTLFVAAYTIFRLAVLRKRKLGSFFASPQSNKAGDQDLFSRWRERNSLAIAVQTAFGVSIGLATGLFGVGGAGLTMVVFLLVFKLRAKLMLGTSLMASLFRYAGGSLGYLSTGLINPVVFLVLVSGGGIGSVLGARFVISRTKDIYIRTIVVAMLLFISFEFLTK